VPKHIVRLIILAVVFGAVALIAKWYFTVDSFFEFGHYRANSVPEIAAQEPAYRTARYCQGCHSERHAQWSANNHKSVTCETCHGAAQGHPEKGKLPIPADTVQLCTLCHEAMPGRPGTQPQIQVARHSSGQQCKGCHNPHAPKIAAAAVKVTGDVAAGRQRAAACASCHGAAGISPNDTWPNLAGQSAAYLARILAAYKSGDQKDAVMTPLAQPLSDGDIRNLAAHYASLTCKALAKNCASCHGDTGIAANPAWPHLAGQKAGYLVNVLKAFRGGLRKDPMMAAVVRGLSDADIDNLAAYYAVQSCRPVTEARKTP
jgi:cytochrome c553